MPKYDLVDNDELETIRYKLYEFDRQKERNKRIRNWMLGIVALVALLGFIGIRNPQLIQQMFELPTTLAESGRSRAIVLETNVVQTNAGQMDAASTAEDAPDPNEEANAVNVAVTPTVVQPIATATSAATATATSGTIAQEPTIPVPSPTLSSLVSSNGASDAESGVAEQPEGNASSVSNPVAYSGLLLQDQRGALTVVGPDGASVLDAPDGELLTIVTPGSPVIAHGRTDNQAWVLLTTDKVITGWVSADALMLTLSGVQVETLPVESTLAAISASESAENLQVAQVLPSPTATSPTATPVPTLRPSSTPSPTPIPTSTYTPQPTPVQVATPTRATNASRAATIFAVVRSQGATLRDSPDGGIVRSLGAGFTLDAIARSEDSAWLQVQTSDDEIGWVGAERVVAFRINSLPVAGANNVQTAPTPIPAVEIAENEDADESATDEPTVTSNSASNVEQDSANEVAASDLAEASDAEEATVRPAVTPRSTATTRPAATARPTPVNSEGSPIALIQITDVRLNIRNGPDSTYQIIGKAMGGEQFAAFGRSEDGAWIQIEVLDLAGEFGWVAAEFVALSESSESIPLSSQVNFSAPVYTEN